MQEKLDGILALDFGTRRVGLAISHGYMAEPLASITYLDKEDEFYRHIKRLVNEQKVGKIVIGLPLEEGKASRQSAWIKEQSLKLAEKINIEIEFVDESYSTLQALEELGKNGDLDSQAAKVILEQYLVDLAH